MLQRRRCRQWMMAAAGGTAAGRDSQVLIKKMLYFEPLVVSPNRDDLPLVGSVHGRKILSQLCSIAGNGAAQDATFDTTPAEPNELLVHAKSLIDKHLKLAWDPALEQIIAIDKIL
jgi:hypothetical protein